ncbi:RHOMBOID-like protein 5 [Hevea brasiliensis]|uniref:RHOMBOID-like protein 5 n=1 Tax=Hevea brasiliensis TaxID=3981 RepID=UPI0025D356A8|nr:RHOMBOID-like protein 5 [Hevea brasiliensis]
MGKRPPSPDIEKSSYVKHPPPPPFTPPPPEQWCSWVVPLIFAANITMFVYAMYVNDCPATTGSDNCILYDLLGRFSFQPLKENAVLGPSVITLHRLGALDPIAIVNGGEGWRFFSCIWLHAGVAHLFTNMMSLLFIGIPLEQEFGFLRIGVLYVLSGFGGSLMSALSPKPNISVGASGALLGLLGSMLSELFLNWTIYANKCKSVSTLLLIITLNLAFGLIPHVDNSAHIGGFLSGFLLGFILLMRPQYGYVSRRYIPAGYDIKRKPKHKCYQYMMLITALIVLIIGYLWGLTLLYSGRRLKFSHQNSS